MHPSMLNMQAYNQPQDRQQWFMRRLFRRDCLCLQLADELSLQTIIASAFLQQVATICRFICQQCCLGK